MKTNLNLSERVKESKTGKQFNYVLDCIVSSSHATDYEITFKTDYDKIKMFFDGFNSEFNYIQNKKRFPNLQTRIKEYIAGLPSYISVDFENSKIISIGQSWGFCTTERKKDDFLNNWFNVIAFRLLQIAAKVGYNTSNLI